MTAHIYLSEEDIDSKSDRAEVLCESGYTVLFLCLSLCRVGVLKC